MAFLEERAGTKTDRHFADEVQQVLTMLNDPDSYVQHVFYSKNKVPSFILYTKQYLESLKSNRMLSKNQCVLGIDRTYNL